MEAEDRESASAAVLAPGVLDADDITAGVSAGDSPAGSMMSQIWVRALVRSLEQSAEPGTGTLIQPSENTASDPPLAFPVTQEGSLLSVQGETREVHFPALAHPKGGREQGQDTPQRLSQPSPVAQAGPLLPLEGKGSPEQGLALHLSKKSSPEQGLALRLSKGATPEQGLPLYQLRGGRRQRQNTEERLPLLGSLSVGEAPEAHLVQGPSLETLTGAWSEERQQSGGATLNRRPDTPRRFRPRMLEIEGELWAQSDELTSPPTPSPPTEHSAFKEKEPGAERSLAAKGPAPFPEPPVTAGTPLPRSNNPGEKSARSVESVRSVKSVQSVQSLKSVQSLQSVKPAGDPLSREPWRGSHGGPSRYTSGKLGSRTQATEATGDLRRTPHSAEKSSPHSAAKALRGEALASRFRSEPQPGPRFGPKASARAGKITEPRAGLSTEPKTGTGAAARAGKRTESRAESRAGKRTEPRTEPGAAARAGGTTEGPREAQGRERRHGPRIQRESGRGPGREGHTRAPLSPGAPSGYTGPVSAHKASSGDTGRETLGDPGLLLRPADSSGGGDPSGAKGDASGGKGGTVGVGGGAANAGGGTTGEVHHRGGAVGVGRGAAGAGGGATGGRGGTTSLGGGKVGVAGGAAAGRVSGAGGTRGTPGSSQGRPPGPAAPLVTVGGTMEKEGEGEGALSSPGSPTPPGPGLGEGGGAPAVSDSGEPRVPGSPGGSSHGSQEVEASSEASEPYAANSTACPPSEGVSWDLPPSEGSWEASTGIRRNDEGMTAAAASASASAAAAAGAAAAAAAAAAARPAWRQAGATEAPWEPLGGTSKRSVGTSGAPARTAWRQAGPKKAPLPPLMGSSFSGDIIKVSPEVAPGEYSFLGDLIKVSPEVPQEGPSEAPSLRSSTDLNCGTPHPGPTPWHTHGAPHSRELSMRSLVTQEVLSSAPVGGGRTSTGGPSLPVAHHNPQTSLESRVLACLHELMVPGGTHLGAQTQAARGAGSWGQVEIRQPDLPDDVIPPFYTKRPHPDSLTARMQRCAKYRFLQKQKELLLSSGELHQVWNCLREFCVRDAEGGESDAIDYSGFLAAGKACGARLGHRGARLFKASTFLTFAADAAGTIPVVPLYLYFARSALLSRLRIDMMTLDSDNDGFLTPQEMEAFVRGMVPSLRLLGTVEDAFLPLYCAIATRKFLFFGDPQRKGKLRIKDLLLSPVLTEMMELHEPIEDEEEREAVLQGNWFAQLPARQHYELFLALDVDESGGLSPQELQEFSTNITPIFIQRVFDVHVHQHGPRSASHHRHDSSMTSMDSGGGSTDKAAATGSACGGVSASVGGSGVGSGGVRGSGGGSGDGGGGGGVGAAFGSASGGGSVAGSGSVGGCGGCSGGVSGDEGAGGGGAASGSANGSGSGSVGPEMGFPLFLDLMLALEHKDRPQALAYLFRCLDLQDRGYITAADIDTLFRPVHSRWSAEGLYDLRIEDVKDEIFDMVKPQAPLRITFRDLVQCKQGAAVCAMLFDVGAFWAHDNRENLPAYQN